MNTKIFSRLLPCLAVVVFLLPGAAGAEDNPALLGDFLSVSRVGASPAELARVNRICEINWKFATTDVIIELPHHYIYVSSTDCEGTDNQQVCRAAIFSTSSDACMGGIKLAKIAYLLDSGNYPRRKWKGQESGWPIALQTSNEEGVAIYEWPDHIEVLAYE